MDVFVIPLAGDRYELYCEPEVETATASDTTSTDTTGGVRGWARQFMARWRTRISAMLEAAERRETVDSEAPALGWLGRQQDRMLAWVAERIAEQRLLWNLRSKLAAVVVHPQDMTFEQVMTLVRSKLQHDYDRHRRWLIIDTIGMILSWPLVFVPGPNVLLYYFMLRVGGHWLSMRGARQGLDHVQWTGRACPPLGELRDVSSLEPQAREARLGDIAAQLRLEHLARFYDRVAV